MSFSWVSVAVLSLVFPVSSQDPGTDIKPPENQVGLNEVDETQFFEPCFRGASRLEIPARSLDGNWELTWDDTVDRELDNEDKSCNLKIKEIGHWLTGDFIGPVAGVERNAIITGTIEGSGNQRVLSFQQRENGYLCSYQATLTDGPIVGVWHDTQNRSGTFRLLKYQ